MNSITVLDSKTSTKPIVAIYVAPKKSNEVPTFANEYYNQAYPDLFTHILRNGAELVLLQEEAKTYQGNGVFSEYWHVTLVDDELRYKKFFKDIKVNVIYDKARFNGDNKVKVINPSSIIKLTANKYETYKYLPELHPKTRLLNSKIELLTYLNDQANDLMLVVKGLDSNGGNEVWIDRVEGLKKLDINIAPVLVQDFLDCSKGIPGIAKGNHDLRVAIFNGEIIKLQLREPKAGSHLSNLAQGGKNTILPLNKLPDDLIAVIKKIDSKLSNFKPYYYSIDFALANKNWYVFELNPWPGLSRDADGLEAQRANARLARHLISASQPANGKIKA